jgi:uncharacterized protein (TIGR03435 family)
MAGVTGSDLKRRVTSIMAAPVGGRLGVIARVVFALAMAAIVAVPVINGAARVPQISSTITLPDPSKTFEAASVRQNNSGAGGASSSSGTGNLRVRNMFLKAVLLSAFPIQEAQLIGGPEWLATDRFDIVAKASTSTPDADLHVMLQNLLIQRFSMKMHVETRSLPIYALTLARADRQIGPDMHVLDPGSGVKVGAQASGGFGATNMHLFTSMEGLAGALSRLLGRSVVDRTGLNGGFELTCRYTLPGAPAAADSDSAQRAPEIFTALQEQLGLKLEATRGPVEVLVIDSVEHPKNDDFEMPAQ